VRKILVFELIFQSWL